MHKIIRTFTRHSPFIVAFILFIGVGYAPESLIFDRQAIAAGEFWRLITGHFVHCDFEHVMLNLLGLWGMILIFDSLSAKTIWISLVAGMVFVDVWIWFKMPELVYYCGLSGIENSLLAVGIGSVWQNRQPGLAIISGLLSVAKIIYEITSKTALFSHVAWQSVPQAHAAGFAAGMFCIGFVWLFATPKKLTVSSLYFSFKIAFATITRRVQYVVSFRRSRSVFRCYKNFFFYILTWGEKEFTYPSHVKVKTYK